MFAFSRAICRVTLVLALGWIGLSDAQATSIVRDLPPGLHVPEAARPGPAFDVDKATAAYLNMLSPEQRQLSDAYIDGSHWLELWNFLCGLGVSAVLLLTGLSQRMRDFAQRVSPRPWLYTLVYAASWVAIGFILALPLSIYTDFVREHQYGLSEQGFGGWMGDQLKSLAVGLVVVPAALSGIYAAVRRAGVRWWIWATVFTSVFNLLLTLVAPVFVSPLFNDYRPLPEGAVHDAVYSLLRANGIPTDHVEWFDASKQTTRISANVSGLWGTTRVNLNDNLLNQTSLPEIKAAVGHEMGHYVLNHGIRFSIYVSLLFGGCFWLLHRSLDRALRRWGPHLKLGDRSDPAALPLAVAIVSVFVFVATPIFNGIVRQCEEEADSFGLNAAREPYAFAMIGMRGSTYRKTEPGPIEEIIFNDHPSGYERVHRAMVWLKENPMPELAAEASDGKKP